MAAPTIFIKCAHCTCMSGAFRKLSREQLARVDQNRTELKYKKGENLCKQGAFISNTIFIKKGLVKIYLESNTNPLIINIEKGGYFLGVSSLVGSNVFQYTAEALIETEVCQVDVNIYRELLHENAEFAIEVLQMANNDTIKAYERITSLTQKQLPGRFAELLLHLSENIYESNPFELTITRIDMAELIHSSPESVSRLIKDFCKDTLICVEGNTFEILDEKRLKKVKVAG